MKLKSILDFEDEFDVIKDLISPKTLFMVDDKINLLQQVRRNVIERKEDLQDRVSSVEIRNILLISPEFHVNPFQNPEISQVNEEELFARLY